MTNKSDNITASKKPRYEQSMLATAKGGSILAMGNVFLLAGKFIIAFLLARLLGADEYGLYNLALSAAAIVGIFSLLGLDDAMVRYIPILASSRDEAGLWGVIQIGIMGAVGMSVFMGTLMYFLAGPIAGQIFHEPQLAPLLQLLSFTIPFLALSNVLIGISQGFKKMEYTVIAESFVQLLVRLGLVVVFALLGLDAFLTLIAFALADVAASVALIYLLNRDFAWHRPLNSARRDIREVSSFSLPLWMSGLLRKFRNNIQIILLGSFSTVTNVGIFSLVTRINLIGSTVRLSIVKSVRPIIAELHAQDDREELGRLYQATTRWALIANVPMFLVMVLFPEAILAIFGKSFVGGASALVLLAWAELANAGTGICGAIIDMTGHTKIKLVNSVLWVVLSIGTNVLLIPRWGIIGAAVAVFISFAVINFLRVVQVWYMLRILPYNRSFIKLVAAGLVTFAIVWMIEQWLPAETGLIFTVIDGLIVFAVFAGLVLLLGLAPEDRIVLNRVYRRIGAFVPSRSSSTA